MKLATIEKVFIGCLLLLLASTILWAGTNNKTASTSPSLDSQLISSWKIVKEYSTTVTGQSEDIDIICDMRTGDEYFYWVSSRSFQVLPRMCISGQPEILP